MTDTMKERARNGELLAALEDIVSLPATDGEDTAAGHWFRALDIARTALAQEDER